MDVLWLAKTEEGEEALQGAQGKHKRASGSQQRDGGMRQRCTAVCQAQCFQQLQRRVNATDESTARLTWWPCWSFTYRKDELSLEELARRAAGIAGTWEMDTRADVRSAGFAWARKASGRRVG